MLLDNKWVYYLITLMLLLIPKDLIYQLVLNYSQISQKGDCMPHIDEVELLRKRSLRMLNHAEHCVTTGDYDLASFLAEQAVQLYLKSVILELTGEVPRTHVVRQLFHILRTIIRDTEYIDEFIRKNRRLLVGLEEAYLASRYLFRIYEKEEAEELVNFAKEVIRFVRNIKSKT